MREDEEKEGREVREMEKDRWMMERMGENVWGKGERWEAERRRKEVKDEMWQGYIIVRGGEGGLEEVRKIAGREG